MQQTTYESHRHPDPGFPVIFHLDTLEGRQQLGGPLHWHENVELLFCIEGEATVLSNMDRVPMKAGDLVVVNSNHLHALFSEEVCRYYCLIADKALLSSLGLPVGELLLQPRVTDPAVQEHFLKIIGEMEEKRPYYKAAVLARMLALGAILFRDYPAEAGLLQESRRDSRLEMVKDAVGYIRRRCCEELTIDEICRYVGFSKYYFCHAFKEITGSTVVGYINYLRCENARRLLSTGQYNISESAERSGFRNMSYFTRTYKAQMGALPSGQSPHSGGNGRGA